MNLVVIRGSEITLSTTANTVSNGVCVRIVNVGTAVKLTQKDSSNNTIGSFTVGNNGPVFVRKGVNDTLETASGNVFAVSVGFSS